MLLFGGLGYLLFYSPWLQVNTVAFQGISTHHQAETEEVIEGFLGRKIFGLPVGRSMVFIRTGKLEAQIKTLSFLENASVDKDFFHTLNVKGIERQAEGVWCFGAAVSETRECRYFDRVGIVWGQALQSSGFLLLNIDDERLLPDPFPAKIDERFLSGIQKVVEGLKDRDVKIKKVIIPSNSFTEFHILVSEGYVVRFSLDSDLLAQVEAYRIFKEQKLMGGDFHPQYIDMRFDGRVYFK